MKHLRTYENFESSVKELNRMPRTGDFVQLNYKNDEQYFDVHNTYDAIKDVINNNIGEVVELKHMFELLVKYNYSPFKDDPGKITQYINSDTNHIVDFAPTREELEIKLTANKFNI